MYLQFFLGFSSFLKDPIFDPSSFVDFRKRMGLQAFEELNTATVKFSLPQEEPDSETKKVMAGG